MQIDFFGLRFDTPRISCYLWSPWRASALEHRLFNEIKQLAGAELEQKFDEIRIDLTELAAWKQALHHVSRLMKGWQEEAADTGQERRLWRWLIEGDTNDHGYDHAGEPNSLWLFLQLAVDRGGIQDDDAKMDEQIDLNGIGFRVWPVK